jgi:hypothetical protein
VQGLQKGFFSIFSLAVVGAIVSFYLLDICITESRRSMTAGCSRQKAFTSL